MRSSALKRGRVLRVRKFIRGEVLGSCVRSEVVTFVVRLRQLCKLRYGVVSCVNGSVRLQCEEEGVK